MRANASFGRILGIRLRLHYTWWVAVLLITATILTQFPEAYPLWQRIVLGIAASLLFFITVSIREFAAILMAISKGIPLRSVTLFVFGGVYQIVEEATRPAFELLMAVAGLLSTLLMAAVFSSVNMVLQNAGSIVVAGLIQWLAFITFMLFLFHFIPGLPLDGGKFLHAVIWRASGDYDRATRIVNGIGRSVGLLLIAGGIAELIVARQWFVGLLLVFMGWVLQSAVAQGRRQAAMHQALQGITAQKVMCKECPFITSELSLGQLVRDWILVSGQHYFFVVDGTVLQGMVTIENIKQVPKERWNSTRVDKIMTPAKKLKTAHQKDSAASLLAQMDELGINQLPVLEKDRVIGMVTWDSLISMVTARTKLGV